MSLLVKRLSARKFRISASVSSVLSFAAFEYESVKLEARICERSPELAVLCAVEGSDVSVGNDTELFASAGGARFARPRSSP